MTALYANAEMMLPRTCISSPVVSSSGVTGSLGEEEGSIDTEAAAMVMVKARKQRFRHILIIYIIPVVHVVHFIPSMMMMVRVVCETATSWTYSAIVKGNLRHQSFDWYLTCTEVPLYQRKRWKRTRAGIGGSEANRKGLARKQFLKTQFKKPSLVLFEYHFWIDTALS
ncbi:hypothetical protein CPB84DRAFT_1751337 [Gymnopilus junonius]|uniref:Uncharacterized protein n=1 Tax=Gymnopilus junonius TaxID=109634 RepID=A0A9P5TI87_GYMJU|nr:hypothetical protein CPB84DRAFT_1751337 [Gymnopilus junonius]